MKSKTLFMETTQIPASQTVGEIQRVLGEYGASAILVEYENGEPSGIVFNIRAYDRDVPFRLPCRWKAILDIFQLKRTKKKMDGRGRPFKIDLSIQAKRVAWRQILRWIEAQLAFSDSGMVDVKEIFIPFLLIGKNETLYQKLDQTKFLEYKK